ncbi:MAG: Omp28-related outer membrane protein [Tidjanibacter sp.]|nr:Omp28-related outer membrane protein [Tidjanibacter sp.]
MKILKFFVTALAILGAVACNPTPSNTPTEKEHSFKVIVSKQVIIPNGVDAAVFTATFDGEVVTEGVEVYDGEGKALSLNGFAFTTEEEGDFQFLFKYSFEDKTYESELFTIAAKNLSVNVNATIFQKDVDDVYFEIYYRGNLITYPDDDLAILDYATHEEVELAGMEVELNGETVTLPKFIAPSIGEHKIYIYYKTSNTYKKPLVLTAVDFAIPKRIEDPQPENLTFTKRTFFTQFTGAGCQYCPFISAALHDMKNDATVADKFVNVGIHTYNDSADLSPLDCQDIDERFGVSNYPVIIGDMKFRTSNVGKWEYNRRNLTNYVEQSVAEGAKAGLSASISGEGSTIVIRATLKASENGNYRLGAWLVEDDVYSPQTSALTAPYPEGMEANDLNYHEAVLRIADSNPANSYTGHSLGYMNAGDKVDYVFVMNIKEDADEASKTNEKMNHKKHWVKENCRIILFATADSSSGYYVTNAISNTSLTENIAFDYK